MNNQSDYLNDINILKKIIEEKYNNNNIFSFKETYSLYRSIDNIENFFKNKINMTEDMKEDTDNKIIMKISEEVNREEVNRKEVNRKEVNRKEVNRKEVNREEVNNIDDLNNINKDKENDVNINDMFRINMIEKEIKNILLENIIKSDIEDLFFKNLNI